MPNDSKQTFRIATILAALLSIGHAFPVMAQEITFAEIKEVWKNTAISQASCKIRLVSWNAGGFDPFSNEVVEQSSHDVDGAFFRDAKLGMKLEYGDTKSNLIGDVGGYISPGPSHNSFQYQRKGETDIESFGLTNELLYWIDPIAIIDRSILREVSTDTEFPIVVDPKFGQVVKISVFVKASQTVENYMFAKTFDWRLVKSTIGAAKPTYLKEVEYNRKDSMLILKSVKIISLNNDKPTSRVSYTVKEAKAECNAKDLELEIPPRTVVFNLDGTRLLVNSDGSKRKVLPEELKLVKYYDELFDTPEGSLLKKKSD